MLKSALKGHTKFIMKKHYNYLFLVSILILSLGLQSDAQTVKRSNYGYAYADNAAVLNFISPIKESWGRLINVQQVNKKSEKWTFETPSKVTLVFLTIKENIIAGHSLLQIDKIFHIQKSKN
jgi:hypothetical protein